MIDTVEELDLKAQRLSVRRTFSRAVDLWIDDHRPLKSLKHPLVSAIMAVEAFLEAAHLLYPYLVLRGVRRLAFEDILECPAGVEREARITCHKAEGYLQEIRCDVQLASADISPSGRPLDRWSTHYRGQVLLGPEKSSLAALPDFDVKPGELNTPAMGPREIQAGYETRTGLTGRYRVLERIHGSGADVISGEMVYRQGRDTAGAERTAFRYSPYLLEGLMHLFAFHAALHHGEAAVGLIPAEMEEMRFTRLAADGERFTLVGRLRAQDEQGVLWDARALDETGSPVLQVTAMRMNRFGG